MGEFVRVPVLEFPLESVAVPPPPSSNAQAPTSELPGKVGMNVMVIVSLPAGLPPPSVPVTVIILTPDLSVIGVLVQLATPLIDPDPQRSQLHANAPPICVDVPLRVGPLFAVPLMVSVGFDVGLVIVTLEGAPPVIHCAGIVPNNDWIDAVTSSIECGSVIRLCVEPEYIKC